jgi:hypothetical protein
MNGLFLTMVFSVVSAVVTNDWTPPVAAEGAIVTLEMEISPTPKPKPKPDGAGKGAKIESPLDTYRDAKALIDKGNALADRGKAILDQAQREGKITVDIRLPDAAISDPRPKRSSCSGGVCTWRNDAEEDAPSKTNPSCSSTGGGAGKHLRFLRWRR